MTGRTRRQGFTLIEVLIVVVIMAVLAATIIPQFSTSTKDARESSIKFNLQSLRTQIELYRLQHNGAVPTLLANGQLTQLIFATDLSGATNSLTAVDPTHPFGPYVQGGAFPTQPFSGLNTVILTSDAAPTATMGNGGGWIYNTSTGALYIDHPLYVTY